MLVIVAVPTFSVAPSSAWSWKLPWIETPPVLPPPAEPLVWKVSVLPSDMVLTVVVWKRDEAIAPALPPKPSPPAPWVWPPPPLPPCPTAVMVTDAAVTGAPRPRMLPKPPTPMPPVPPLDT